jgi:hypothetical protein
MLDRFRTLAAAACLALQPALAQPSISWRDVPDQTTAQETNEPGWTQLPSKSTDAPIGIRWTPVSTDQSPAIAKPSWTETPADSTEVATPPASPAKPSQTRPPYTWPNGQPMSPADRRFYSTAFSRGSLIQIGETIYPNLGFNALQRQPDSWGSVAIAAIDNSFQSYGSASVCARGDFSSTCADGLAEIYVRLWNSKDFSFDLQWSIHSLSGGPFSFADRTGGTSFGEGQSLGFRLAKNLTPTFGITFGANRLIHLDRTTDLPKNLYLMGTKVIRTNQKPDSPIISISLGIMSDVYNPNTNLGSMQYPQWLLGGEYPSIFAEYFDKRQTTSGRGYYPNVAGVTSPFVCAEQSIFAFKPISAANPDCIKQVTIGPVGSIGFAPWPWLGFYAIYEGNLNLGVSVKPFTNVPWTISLQAVHPFTGINPRDDAYISEYPCAGQDLSTCRTRIGLFTDLSF